MLTILSSLGNHSETSSKLVADGACKLVVDVLNRCNDDNAVVEQVLSFYILAVTFLKVHLSFILFIIMIITFLLHIGLRCHCELGC
jgi:type IV secretory pathway TrbL component